MQVVAVPVAKTAVRVALVVRAAAVQGQRLQLAQMATQTKVAAVVAAVRFNHRLVTVAAATAVAA
jgi:hypothetical protein